MRWLRARADLDFADHVSRPVQFATSGDWRLAAELRGDDAAQAIQLHIAYAPEPPFNSGTPETAPPAILQQARQSVQGITAQREATARLVSARLGVAVPS